MLILQATQNLVVMWRMDFYSYEEDLRYLIGNMATASFPNSNYSWMARSRDEDIPTPSRLRVFAIGISANLMKPNPTGQPTSIGNVETTFASSESLASWAS